jgi:hypothetical protein
MSGVLERMILRTRSALAGIEPLLAPRYAASEGFHETGDRPIGTAESGVRRAPAPRQRRTEPGRPARIIAPSHAASPSSPVTPAFPQEDARAGSSPRQDPVVNDVPGPPSIAADVHVAAPDVSSVSSPLPATPGEPQQLAAREPLIASARIVSGGDDAAAQYPRSRVALTADSGGRAEPAALFEHDAAPASISKESRAPQRPAFAANGEVSAAPPQVTISIGHVEIRAAPVSQPPRRPAFRPRVTLDDFLGRRSGEPR